MRFALSALLLLTASASAQTYEPLPRLKEFLQLSDSQLATLLANNSEYNRFSQEKQTRIRQVQTEIAQETAREPLDPGALGIRYAEIEAICRHLKAEANDSQKKNVEALTEAQRTKLKVLEEALKLIPTVSEAQSWNLLGPITVAPPAFISTTGTFLLGSMTASGTNGCTPAASAWFESPGFRFNPVNAPPAAR